MVFYFQARKSATVIEKPAIRVTSGRSNVIAMNSRPASLALIAESAHIQSYVHMKTPILDRQAVRQDQQRTTANQLLRINTATNRPGRMGKASQYCLVFMLPALPTVPTDPIHKSMTTPPLTRLTMGTIAAATLVHHIPRRRRRRLSLVKLLRHNQVIKRREARRICRQEQRHHYLVRHRHLRLTLSTSFNSRRIWGTKSILYYHHKSTYYRMYSLTIVYIWSSQLKAILASIAHYVHLSTQSFLIWTISKQTSAIKLLVWRMANYFIALSPLVDAVKNQLSLNLACFWQH
jgi:hypothetical protein